MLTFGQLGVGDIVAYALSETRTRWGIVTEIEEKCEVDPRRRFRAVFSRSIEEAEAALAAGDEGSWIPYGTHSLVLVRNCVAQAREELASLAREPETGAWRLMC